MVITLGFPGRFVVGFTGFGSLSALSEFFVKVPDCFFFDPEISREFEVICQHLSEIYLSRDLPIWDPVEIEGLRGFTWMDVNPDEKNGINHPPIHSLKLTASSPLKMGLLHLKRKANCLPFPSFFRCKLAVSFRGGQPSFQVNPGLQISSRLSVVRPSCRCCLWSRNNILDGDFSPFFDANKNDGKMKIFKAVWQHVATYSWWVLKVYSDIWGHIQI